MKEIKFEGSRNFCSEQVYDLIWELPPESKIEVEILKDGKISVRYF